MVLLLLLGLFGQARAEQRAWAKTPSVVIVSSRDDDPRVTTAREAIDFWNQALAGLGSPFRLGPVVVVSASIPAGTMPTLREQMLRGEEPRRFPESLWRLPGDLIVVLSDEGFISFEARTVANDRVLVGIRSDRLYPLTLANVTRNVLAHELGHAIGLEHNNDPKTLMCGRPAPCRPSVFESRQAKFFPLTDVDKARLSDLYPPTWKGRE